MPPSAELPGFLAGVAPILDRWGYLAIAGVIGVESFGVPAPGQTIMVAAAIYAGAGRMNIYGVAAICFVAAVLGDNVGYWIGKRGGRRVVHRFGKYIFLTPARFEKAEKFFQRRGNRIVVVARFIDGLRQLNGVIAGVTDMPWRAFLLYNAIGAALWVGWWTTVSYLLGTHLVEIFETAERYKWWAIGLGVLAVGTYVIFHVRHVRRRRARAEDLPDDSSSDDSPSDLSPSDVSPSDLSPSDISTSSSAAADDVAAASSSAAAASSSAAAVSSSAAAVSSSAADDDGATAPAMEDAGPSTSVVHAATDGETAGQSPAPDGGKPPAPPTHAPRRAARNKGAAVNRTPSPNPAATTAARSAAADPERGNPKP